jgi:hypothetical protein
MNSSPVKAVDVNELEDLEVGKVEKVYWAEHASMDAERMKAVKTVAKEEAYYKAVKVCGWMLMVVIMITLIVYAAVSQLRPGVEVMRGVAEAVVLLVEPVTLVGCMAYTCLEVRAAKRSRSSGAEVEDMVAVVAGCLAGVWLGDLFSHFKYTGWGDVGAMAVVVATGGVFVACCMWAIVGCMRLAVED